MRIISFDGWQLESESFFIAVPGAGGYSRGFEIDPEIMQRAGGISTYATATVTERTVQAVLGYRGTSLTAQNAISYALGRLDPLNIDPRLLVAERNDAVQVQAYAIVSPAGALSDDDGIALLPIMFILSDPVWRETSSTSTTVTITSITDDQTMALPVGGHAPVFPTIRLKPTAIRSTEANDSTYGWKYRRQITLTNNGARTISGEVVEVSLGDTTTGWTGVLSTGNDVRVWDENGFELPRNLVNWNTKKSHMWVYVEHLPVGGVKTLDLVYGNSQAGAPPLLTSDGSNAIGNPSYATDLSGWSEGAPLNMTATWARDTGVFDSTPASVACTVTASSAGGFDRLLYLPPIPVSPGQTLNWTSARRTSNVNLIPRVQIYWYGSEGVTGPILSSSFEALWTPTAGAWSNRTFSATAPNGATLARVQLVPYSIAASATGTVYFDTHSLPYSTNDLRYKPAFDIRYDSGTASAGGGASVLADTDSSKAWVTDQWQGGEITVTGGAASGDVRTISSNTSNTVTVSSAFSATPDATSTYVIRASTMDRRVYRIENTTDNGGRGLWYLKTNEAGTKQPSEISFDGPGRWRRSLRLENRDDYAQAPWSKPTADYIARFDASRYRDDAAQLTDEQLADGIMYSSPFGITNLNADYTITNKAAADGSAVGKFIIEARESGGEQWESLYEYSTTQASPATITPSLSITAPYPTQIALSVQPRQGVEIPSTETTSVFITVTNNTYFELSLDTSDLDVSAIGAEANIHDLYCSMRLNGGQSATVFPYHKVHIGGSGTSGRVAIPINNYLVIDGEAQTAAEWDSTLTTKVRDIPGAVAFERHESIDGTDTAFVAADWFRTVPRPNLVTNANFGTDLTGWSLNETDSGITVSWTRDTGTYRNTGAWSANASLKGDITANTSGGTDKKTAYKYTNVATSPGRVHTLSMDCRTSTTNITPALRVDWLDSGLSLISTSYSRDTSITANQWYRQIMTTTAQPTAAWMRISAVMWGVTTNPTGQNYFANVQLDGNDLVLSTVDVSTTVEGSWDEGYL